MKRFIIALIMGVMALTGMNMVAMSEPAYAGSCNQTFLGMRAWYYDTSGTLCTGDGELKLDSIDKDGAKLGAFVWKIVLNITYDIMVMTGYIATAMVIYGGYMYMMSSGDPGKAAKGQKTLTAATIGVIISMGASVIVNTAIEIMGIDRNSISGNSNFSVTTVNNIFGWFYGVAGLIAVIFVIKGGVDYLTSAGNPAKAQKGRKTLIYALVGLGITILASAITGFIVGKVGDSLKTGEVLINTIGALL